MLQQALARYNWRCPINKDTTATTNVMLDVAIPDSQLAREVAQRSRDTESEPLFNRSTRVYLWGALLGKRKGVAFDPELLYVAATFHDIGLTSAYRDSEVRFEVDGANAARDFLRSHPANDCCH